MNGPPPNSIDPPHRRGFTMVELLVAITILAAVTAVTYSTFSAVTKAWQRGLALSESLHHGDFVMEQLVAGLRAARHRGAADGFWLTDKGRGANASDTICWVKEGAELVGEDTDVSKSYHRIRFAVQKAGRAEEAGATITAWGDEYLQPEDFEAEDLPPVLLSRQLVGFNCRVATNSVDDDTLDWLDTWEDEIGGADNMTNHVPRYVELTLFLEPLSKDEDPVEMKRCVEIPIANLGMK
jgi:prepilin-type N-terminal cleavage/methylation domain-containing protein